MVERDVFVVVSMPAGLRAALGEERLQQLVAAHPRVEVALAADPDRFAELLPRADAALVWPTMAPLLAPALRPGGRLRWVHSIPAGVEGVLTPDVLAAGHVPLTATKGPQGPQGPFVAAHALALMLALGRGLPGFARAQAARRWGGAWPPADVVGQTVLILGVGGVGGHLARMCRVGLGMTVLGTSRTRRDDPHVARYIEPGDLHAALGEADFVALCLALTPETAGIIDAAALAAMRSTAYLVNVARGGLVDEQALVAVLRDERIAGAGLDATAVEPPPEESPLWGLPNVLITPHVAGGRGGSMDGAIAFLGENIRRFVAGAPLLGVVDRRARY
jgi:phosphoglycerate dehydrogenase-like enzyme